MTSAAFFASLLAMNTTAIVYGCLPKGHRFVSVFHIANAVFGGVCVWLFLANGRAE